MPVLASFGDRQRRQGEEGDSFALREFEAMLASNFAFQLGATPDTPRREIETVSVWRRATVAFYCHPNSGRGRVMDIEGGHFTGDISALA